MGSCFVMMTLPTELLFLSNTRCRVLVLLSVAENGLVQLMFNTVKATVWISTSRSVFQIFKLTCYPEADVNYKDLITALKLD